MIRFLLKGLMRDRSRSLFPILMVAAGAFLTVFLYSWMQGVFADMVMASARFDTGHVKIVTRAYKEMADQNPNDLALVGVGDLLSRLRRSHDGLTWTPRIRFGGLLDIPDERGETRAQGPVAAMGVDLLGPGSPEKTILDLAASLVRGRLPEAPDEILVSDEFASRLGVRMGEQATFVGSTMHGAMAMYNFRIAGTVRFGVAALDRGMVIADLRGVRAALDMPDAASEVLGYSADMVYADRAMTELAMQFNAALPPGDDEFSPTMISLREQSALGEMLDLMSVAGSIIVAVFVAAMSVVLWNAGLMNGLRRYGEIGVRLAMGEPKGDVYRRLILESVSVGVVGSALGTVLGLAISYYMQYNGLDFGSMMRDSAIIMSNVMRARVTPLSYVLGFVPGLFAPVLGTTLAGIGVFRRQTAQLFKELEV